jgi:hypothetical protein
MSSLKFVRGHAKDVQGWIRAGELAEGSRAIVFLIDVAIWADLAEVN